MQWLINHGRVGGRNLDAIEFFSGAATLTSALRSGGRNCATFELRDEATQQNILSTAGLLYAIELIIKAMQVACDFKCEGRRLLQNLDRFGRPCSVLQRRCALSELRKPHPSRPTGGAVGPAWGNPNRSNDFAKPLARGSTAAYYILPLCAAVGLLSMLRRQSARWRILSALVGTCTSGKQTLWSPGVRCSCYLGYV